MSVNINGLAVSLGNLCAALGGWSPEDGPAPGVYDSAPPGHRCAWSVRWAAPGGVIESWRILPLETMSYAQFQAELDDIIHRQGVHPETYFEAVRLAEVQEVGDWRTFVGPRLAALRAGYPEYTAPWVEGWGKTVVYRWVWRPGWGVDDIQRARLERDNQDKKEPLLKG